MSPDEKQLLQKTLELTEENNKILRHMRSSNRWSATIRIFYWILIIGVSVGAFYYLQPYLDLAKKLYGSSQTDLNQIQNVISKVQGTGK